jgi:hypothetical protein
MGLPVTKEDLVEEITKLDTQGDAVVTEDEFSRQLLMRLALAQLLIDKSLEAGEITAEEAAYLRDKHVLSRLRAFSGENQPNDEE